MYLQGTRATFFYFYLRVIKQQYSRQRHCSKKKCDKNKHNDYNNKNNETKGNGLESLIHYCFVLS